MAPPARNSFSRISRVRYFFSMSPIRSRMASISSSISSSPTSLMISVRSRPPVMTTFSHTVALSLYPAYSSGIGGSFALTSSFRNSSTEVDDNPGLNSSGPRLNLRFTFAVQPFFGSCSILKFAPICCLQLGLGFESRLAILDLGLDFRHDGAGTGEGDFAAELRGVEELRGSLEYFFSGPGSLGLGSSFFLTSVFAIWATMATVTGSGWGFGFGTPVGPGGTGGFVTTGGRTGGTYAAAPVARPPVASPPTSRVPPGRRGSSCASRCAAPV